MTSEGIIKLGDFGISKMLDYTSDFAKTSLGTPYYLSPEICSGHKYNFKTDIWMLGCLLYELCTLHKPFEGESLHGVMTKILSQPYMPLPKQYSETLGGLIKMMLEKNPNLRASVDDLLLIPDISKLVNEIQKNEIYKNCAIDLTKLTSSVQNMMPELLLNLNKNDELQSDNNLKENEEEKGLLDIGENIVINDISIKPPPISKNKELIISRGPHAEMFPITKVEANESLEQACEPNIDEEEKIANIDNQTEKLSSEEKKLGPSPGKKVLENKKSYLTINTCFEPNTPVEKPVPAKAASTKSHLRSKQKVVCPIYPKGIPSTATSSQRKTMPKHFVFSDALFSPQAANSPNRPILFTEFLIRKLGKDTFDSACNVLKESVDPWTLLDNEPAKLLKVIGEENAQCVQVFKYIISSNVSTPVHSHLSSQQLQLLQQHHSRTRSMQTPDACMTKIPRLVHFPVNRPYSTKSQIVAGLKPKSTTSAQARKVGKAFMISPLNSAATDASCSPLETPKDL